MKMRDLYCDNCDLTFESIEDLSDHLEKVHSENKLQEPLKCDNCDMLFYFGRLLEIHRKFSCDLCHKFFANLRYLAQHVRLGKISNKMSMVTIFGHNLAKISNKFVIGSM